SIKALNILETENTETIIHLVSIKQKLLEVVNGENLKLDLTSETEKLKEYINNIESANLKEFDKLKDPDAEIVQLFEQMEKIIRKYRQKVEELSNSSGKTLRERASILVDIKALELKLIELINGEEIC
ncbi:MAG: hypothetical protein ACLFQV_09575, partial [Vulcanimicrobiota bacterium]